MSLKQDIENFIKNNPELSRKPRTYTLTFSFMLIAYPVSLSIFPEASEELKTFLHGLLNPILLFPSCIATWTLIVFSEDFKKAILKIFILIPVLTAFGAVLHLYLPWDMPTETLDIYFALLPGVILGAFIGYLNYRFALWGEDGTK